MDVGSTSGFRGLSSRRSGWTVVAAVPRSSLRAVADVELVAAPVDERHSTGTATPLLLLPKSSHGRDDPGDFCFRGAVHGCL
jgi:hypothetical protein